MRLQGFIAKLACSAIGLDLKAGLAAAEEITVGTVNNGDVIIFEQAGLAMPARRDLRFRGNRQPSKHRADDGLPVPLGRTALLLRHAAGERERPHSARGLHCCHDEVRPAAPLRRTAGREDLRVREVRLRRGRALRRGGFPTRTVLCANDRVAFEAGLKVGHGDGCDLRVAGHDDHPLSRYTCPPITTVAQDYEEIGRLAIELLLRRLGSKAEPPVNERFLLSTEIMLRGSA